MPSRRHRRVRRKTRKPLYRKRVRKGSGFGRRSSLSRRSGARRLSGWGSKLRSRGRASVRGRRTSRFRKPILATCNKPRYVKATRSVRYRRPSRSFKNKVNMTVHNPLAVRREERGGTQWSPARCVWNQDILGNNDDLAAYRLQAIGNWQIDAGVGRQAGTNATLLSVQVDSIRHKTMWMNTSNAPCYLDIYKCYPKMDIPNSARTPAVLMETIGSNSTELVDFSIPDPLYPYDPIDYRMTPSQNGYLNDLYRVKKVRTVRLGSGGTTSVTSSIGGFKADAVADVNGSGASYLRKGKSLVILYKFRGDLGYYRPPGAAPTSISVIRTTEGSAASLTNIHAKFHVNSDDRTIARNYYYQDDGITPSTIWSQPVTNSQAVQLN